MNIEFLNEDKWTGLYQRNNKCTGLKNLRCFPYCSDSHHSKGFCGRSLFVRVSTTIPVHSIESWMEMGRYEPDANTRVFHVGELVKRSYLETQTRLASKPTLPMLTGDVTVQENTIQIEYNKRQKGWHYGFVANKHTSEIFHCVRAYVFENTNSSDMLKCVGVKVSKPFKIFCRRRQRHRMNLSKLPQELRKHIESSAKTKEHNNNKAPTENLGNIEVPRRTSKRKCRTATRLAAIKIEQQLHEEEAVHDFEREKRVKYESTSYTTPPNSPPITTSTSLHIEWNEELLHTKPKNTDMYKENRNNFTSRNVFSNFNGIGEIEDFDTIFGHPKQAAVHQPHYGMYNISQNRCYEPKPIITWDSSIDFDFGIPSTIFD